MNFISPVSLFSNGFRIIDSFPGILELSWFAISQSDYCWLNYWIYRFVFRRIHHVSRPSTSRWFTAATSQEKTTGHQQWRQQYDGWTRRPGADWNYTFRRWWTTPETDHWTRRSRISEHQCFAAVWTINSAETLSHIAAWGRLYCDAAACWWIDVCQWTSYHTADNFTRKLKLWQENWHSICITKF